jgi:hypothetical protein
MAEGAAERAAPVHVIPGSLRNPRKSNEWGAAVDYGTGKHDA